MKKYKIAFLGLKGIPAISGADRVVENIIENLNKDKYEITTYGISNYTQIKKIAPNINQVIIKRIPLKNIDIFIYFILSSIHALFKNYDIIHIHNTDCAFIIPILKIKYKNIISTSHGSPYDRNKWNKFIKTFFILMENIFIKYSNIITSVSLPLKNYYKTKTKKKIYYIPNGINLNEKIDYENAKKQLNKKNIPNEFIVFASGRIIPTKGAHIFLNAIKKIDLNKKIVIIGKFNSDKYTKYIKKLMSKTGAYNLGFISSKPILLGLIYYSNFLVFPSEIEAMSMVLLETASVKTPIICSDIPENKAVFNNNESLFFKKNNIDDLANKINWAINNPLSMEEKALNAYNKLKFEYIWEKVTNNYCNLYNNMLLN